MGADLAAFLDQADGGLGVELLQADRRGEAGGAAAYDHHVELHCLPRGQLLGHQVSSRNCRGSVGRLAAPRKAGGGGGVSLASQVSVGETLGVSAYRRGAGEWE